MCREWKEANWIVPRLVRSGQITELWARDSEQANCSYCLQQPQKFPGLMGILDHLWGTLKPLLGVTLGCWWVLRTLNTGFYREVPWEGRELIIGQVSGVGFRWDRLGFKPKVCIYKLCDFSGLFNFLGFSFFICALRLIIYLSYTILIMKWYL